MKMVNRQKEKKLSIGLIFTVNAILSTTNKIKKSMSINQRTAHQTDDISNDVMKWALKYKKC